MKAFFASERNAFLFVGLTIAFLGFWAYMMAYSGQIGWGDMVIGTATLFLAFATFFLAFIEISENKKDRRRLRIKEKLEGLYSPLMANIKLFHDYEQHDYGKPIYRLMLELKNQYIYLAESDLRKILFTYYNTIKIDMNQRNLIEKVEDNIEIDYNKLITEYDVLTRGYL